MINVRAKASVNNILLTGLFHLLLWPIIKITTQMEYIYIYTGEEP